MMAQARPARSPRGRVLDGGGNCAAGLRFGVDAGVRLDCAIRRAHRQPIWTPSGSAARETGVAGCRRRRGLRWRRKVLRRGARNQCRSLRGCTSTGAWWRDRCGNTNGGPGLLCPLERTGNCPPFWRRSPERRRNWFLPEWWRRQRRRTSRNGLTWASPVMIRNPSRRKFSLKTWVVLGRNSGAVRA